MSTQSQHQTMQRKPIMMPPSMIDKVDSIAKERNISFARVVREAVEAFKGPSEDEVLLEALADTMLQTTQDLVKKINTLEKRLDETHALLEDG